jgi:AhpD family alkylhydroperoxidase
MTRISMIPIDQWDGELRNMMRADSATPLEQGVMRMMAHHPLLAKAFVQFSASLWTHYTLPRRLIELIRLRIAFHNQCRSCIAIRYQSAIDDGLTESLVCALEKPFDATDLTAAEKAAIAYADISATDHISIEDSTFSNLRSFYSEPEIVELGIFIAYFIGYGRLSAAWDMLGELPEEFRDKSSVAAPWSMESITVRG